MFNFFFFNQISRYGRFAKYHVTIDLQSITLRHGCSKFWKLLSLFSFQFARRTGLPISKFIILSRHGLEIFPRVLQTFNLNAFHRVHVNPKKRGNWQKTTELHIFPDERENFPTARFSSCSTNQRRFSVHKFQPIILDKHSPDVTLRARATPSLP